MLQNNISVDSKLLNLKLKDFVLKLVFLVFLFMTVFSLYGEARQNKRLTTKYKIDNLAQAIEFFYTDCGFYPSRLSDLRRHPGVRVCSQWGPYPYIKASNLRDSWKREFTYSLKGSSFVITSLGKDGKPGGEGEDQDIIHRNNP